MKTLKTAQALLAVALLGLASSAFAASYTGAFDTAIPDNDPAGADSVISIADSGVITSMTIEVDMDHTWVGDLVMTLTAPDGTVVTLMDRPGFDGVGFGLDGEFVEPITFDDAATTTAEGMMADAGGFIIGTEFSPDDALATLNGLSITGDWTLNINDNAGGDPNMFAPNWTINAEVAVVPVPAAIWFMMSALAGLGFMRRK